MNEYDTDTGLDDSWDVSEGTPENNEGFVDNAEATSSVNDRVTDLLLGGDGGLDSDDGAPSKARNFQTRDLDAHGRIDHGDTQPALQQEQTRGVHDTIYATQVKEQMEHAQSEWHAAHKEAQRLQEMFESGQLSAEDHYRLSYEQGVRASAAKEQAMLSRIQELEHFNQRESQMKALEDLGPEFSPEHRQATLESLVSFAREKGLSDDVLRGVETKDEAAFIFNAWKNERDLQAAQLELKAARQMLKKQNAQLKGRRHTAQKSSQLGTRSGTDAQISQVMDLLAETGAVGGGNKR